MRAAPLRNSAAIGPFTAMIAVAIAPAAYNALNPPLFPGIFPDQTGLRSSTSAACASVLRARATAIGRNLFERGLKPRPRVLRNLCIPIVRRTASIGSKQRRRLMNARTPFFAGAFAASVAFAAPFVTPAHAGNGNDALAQAMQAELHPMMTNQYPVTAASSDTDEADVAPRFHGARAYVPAPSQGPWTHATKLPALGVDPRQQF